jgi:hypothetical protein
MPWHCKPRELIGAVGRAIVKEEREEDRDSATTQLSPRRPRMRNIFRRKQAESKASNNNHFASSVRSSVEAAVDDTEAMHGRDDRSTAIVTLAAGILLAFCFALSPHTALRAILFGQMLLCTLPPIVENWILLIPILLPMKVQSRMEVVLGIGMLSWLGSLDWAFAWDSIQAWRHGHKDKTEEPLGP